MGSFTIGDNATIRRDISPAITISNVMGDESNAKTPEDVLKEAEKKFHLFHIMIGGDNTYNRQLMNGHAMTIQKTDIDLIPQIIISTIQLQNGKHRKDVLNQWDAMERPRLENSLGQLQICTAKRGFFL